MAGTVVFAAGSVTFNFALASGAFGAGAVTNDVTHIGDRQRLGHVGRASKGAMDWMQEVE